MKYVITGKSDSYWLYLKNNKGQGLRLALDLDGVICYWEKSAAETCGIDYEDEKNREEIKNGRRIETFVGGDEKMWPMIDKEGESWWENLEKLPWADDLINLLKRGNKRFFLFKFSIKVSYLLFGKNEMGFKKLS